MKDKMDDIYENMQRISVKRNPLYPPIQKAPFLGRLSREQIKIAIESVTKPKKENKNEMV